MMTVIVVPGDAPSPMSHVRPRGRIRPHIRGDGADMGRADDTIIYLRITVHCTDCCVVGRRLDGENGQNRQSLVRRYSTLALLG